MDNHDAAVRAMKYGASVALISCLLTAAMSVASIVTGRMVLGIDPLGLLDTLLFGVVAWKIFRHSLAWSLFGLLFFVFERYESIVSGGRSSVITTYVTVICLVGYVQAIRGGIYLRKHPDPQPDSAPDRGLSSV